MKYKIVYLLCIISFVCSLDAYGQGQVVRSTKHPSQATKQNKPKQSHTTKPKEGKNKTKEAKDENVMSWEKVSEPDGFINGHGYVDLELPSGIIWATCNVGSEQPWEFGDYFSWGETRVKPDYSINFYSEPKNGSNGCADIDGTEYDIAYTNWGGRLGNTHRRFV